MVTNVGQFIRAYLADLGIRLKNPNLYCAPPLPEILSKLADVGLELKIESASSITAAGEAGVPNVHGVAITGDDLPF
ncbi:MAG: hypothetical protein ACREUU_09260 [Gammaproteobacteria bacterium]